MLTIFLVDNFIKLPILQEKQIYKIQMQTMKFVSFVLFSSLAHLGVAEERKLCCFDKISCADEKDGFCIGIDVIRGFVEKLGVFEVEVTNDLVEGLCKLENQNLLSLPKNINGLVASNSRVCGEDELPEYCDGCKDVECCFGPDSIPNVCKADRTSCIQVSTMPDTFRLLGLTAPAATRKDLEAFCKDDFENLGFRTGLVNLGFFKNLALGDIQGSFCKCACSGGAFGDPHFLVGCFLR